MIKKYERKFFQRVKIAVKETENAGAYLALIRKIPLDFVHGKNFQTMEASFIGKVFLQKECFFYQKILAFLPIFTPYIPDLKDLDFMEQEIHQKGGLSLMKA